MRRGSIPKCAATPRPPGPMTPQGVRFVDHDHRVELLSDRQQLGQRDDVAVHGVHAFDDDQNMVEVAASTLEQLAQGGDVRVRERGPSSSGQCSALPDRVVGQRVVHDEVPVAQQRTQERHVGGVPADKAHGVVHAQEGRQGVLQLGVQRDLSADEPGRGHRRAVLLDRCGDRCGDVRVTVRADVVVGDEVDHVAAADLHVRAGQAGVRDKERVRGSPSCELQVGEGAHRRQVVEARHRQLLRGHAKTPV